MEGNKIVDRKSRDQAWDGSIFGLSASTIKTIEFLAICLGIAAICYEVFIAIPEERAYQRESTYVQLNTSIGLLAVSDDKETASPIIQNVLNSMYQNNFPMKGLAAPYTRFSMAEFPGVDWREVNDFDCSDQMIGNIQDREEDKTRFHLCTQLRGTNFSGASLWNATFRYSDLREVDFISADLSEARIENSVVSGSKFLEDVELRGIVIEYSDFSKTHFEPGARIRCGVRYKNCPKLFRTDFSDEADMDGVTFSGTKIDQVDFTKAKLNEAKFDCDGPRHNPQCTSLKNVCLEKAELEKAKFKDVKISNTDFTGANLTDADFDNVQFENVIFPQINEIEERSIDLDPISKKSLEANHQSVLVSEDQREIPCHPAWHAEIRKWSNKFILP